MKWFTYLIRSFILVMTTLPIKRKTTIKWNGGEYLEVIDKKSRIPLYLQLMDILIEEIEFSLKEGDQLLSEREICEKYNVSRTTVRQAINEMERDGLIYKEHGKGTFVASKKVKQDLIKFYSFTDEMKKLGKNPISEVLSFEIINADRKISRKLKLPENSRVYKFTRLRVADITPMMLEETFVPFDLFPEITKDVLQRNALYDIFREQYQVEIKMADEYFTPVLANENEAKLLKITPMLPSLRIERYTFSANNVIEYTNTIARGDKFKYYVHLEN